MKVAFADANIADRIEYRGKGLFYLITHTPESATKDFHIETEIILVRGLDVMHQVLRLRLRNGKKFPDEKIRRY